MSVAKKTKAAASKKAPPAPAKVEAGKGEFGEKPDTNKGKLIALLVKGKPVKVSDAEKAIYGGPNKAIAGVIIGATMAFEKAGCQLIREGRGADATLTFSRK